MKPRGGKANLILSAAGTLAGFFALAGVAGMLVVVGMLFYPQQTTQSPEFSYKKRDTEAAGSRPGLRKELSSSPVSADPHPDGENPETREKISGSKEAKKLLLKEVERASITLDNFKKLQHHFRTAPTLAEHMDRAEKFIRARLPSPAAEHVIDAYRKYIECETRLQDEFRDFSPLQDPDKAAETLDRIQELRKARLGEKLADKLFAREIKKKKYELKKADIVSDPSMYGDEKQDLIKQLSLEMWGTENPAAEKEKDSYRRYREKLRIYRKDLRDMPSESARQEKINELRREIFDPETADKMASADRQAARQRRREETFKEEKEKILKDPDTLESEKQRRVDRLRSEIFGSRAEAAKRREAIRSARQEMMGQNRQGDQGQKGE